MPTSKKPRKKGRHGLKNAMMKRIIAKGGRGKDIDSELKRFADADLTRVNGYHKLQNLTILTNVERFKTKMTKAMFAINRLVDGDTEDFRLVTSCIGIGGTLLYRVNFSDETKEAYRRDIADGLFGIIRARSMRNRRAPVTQGLLDNIHNGLAAAQELLLWAEDNDRLALADVLGLARADVIKNNDDMNVAKEKALLGRHWDRAEEITRNDAAWLEERGLAYIIEPYQPNQKENRNGISQ